MTFFITSAGYATQHPHAVLPPPLSLSDLLPPEYKRTGQNAKEHMCTWQPGDVILPSYWDSHPYKPTRCLLHTHTHTHTHTHDNTHTHTHKHTHTHICILPEPRLDIHTQFNNHCIHFHGLVCRSDSFIQAQTCTAFLQNVVPTIFAGQ